MGREARPGRRAQHARRPVRRHRLGRVVAVRRSHQHADPRQAGGERPHLQPVAHDRALLSDAVDLPDRPQPPPERLRLDLRVGERLPRATARTSRRRTRTMATVLRDAGWSTYWVGKNHNIPIDAWTRRRLEEGVAARPGLRPLLRLHRRRDQPVVSRRSPRTTTTSTSRTCRKTATTSRRPRRQGARVHPRLEADRARQALVPLVLPRRQPRAAPRAAGVHRQVQGHVRRRLRGLPRVGAAAHDRARHPARGHRADRRSTR